MRIPKEDYLKIKEGLKEIGLYHQIRINELKRFYFPEEILNTIQYIQGKRRRNKEYRINRYVFNNALYWIYKNGPYKFLKNQTNSRRATPPKGRVDFEIYLDLSDMTKATRTLLGDQGGLPEILEDNSLTKRLVSAFVSGVASKGYIPDHVIYSPDGIPLNYPTRDKNKLN